MTNLHQMVAALDRVKPANYGTSVRIYDRLEDLTAKGASLFTGNAAESFFLSPPWFENFCATALEPNDKLRIFCVERGSVPGSPIAALIARYQPSFSLTLRPRTLCSLANFYTSFYAPLFSASCEMQESLDALARSIRHDTPRWDVVDLKWLDSRSPVFDGLLRAFRSAGMVVQTYFCSGNWYSPTEGMSYQQYIEGLRSSVRNIARSKNKKIERSGRARVEIVTGFTGLEIALDSYNRIYASSWKVPEPYPSFIPGLIRTCAAQGWLRLGVAYIDDQPAASQLWVVKNGTASIYKIAYDKRFAELSVGSYLTTRMMEHVLNVDKVREIDFLTGDDKYKQDWMSHRRERWGILAMNPSSPRGTIAIARHLGGRALKNTLKSVAKVIKVAGAPLARVSEAGTNTPRFSKRP